MSDSLRLRKFAITLTLLLVVVSVFFVSKPVQAKPLAAAYNGVQLALYCNTAKIKVDRVIISGKNQNGQQTLYDGAPSDAATTWVVFGWWWKGRVNVSWHIVGKGWYGINGANAPAQHWSTFYTIANC